MAPAAGLVVTRTALDATERAALHRHLVHDHGRPSHELNEMSLDAIHELEHFDAAIGLLRLDHAAH